MEKRTRKKGRGAGDAQGRTGAQEEDIGVSPSLTGRDSNVSVQAVAGGENQPA